MFRIKVSNNFEEVMHGHFCPLEKTPLMKIKLVVIAIVLIGFSACTQKTCPTYAKSGIDKSPQQTEEKAKV